MPRPRMIDFPCSLCGGSRLVCQRTARQGRQIVRYYKCKDCGHRGVLIQGQAFKWWKDCQKISDCS